MLSPFLSISVIIIKKIGANNSFPRQYAKFSRDKEKKQINFTIITVIPVNFNTLHSIFSLKIPLQVKFTLAASKG